MIEEGKAFWSDCNSAAANRASAGCKPVCDKFGGA
jgi:hypothetical protein